jgi:LysM repeat protein
LLTLNSVAAVNGTVVSSVTTTKAPATSTSESSPTGTSYVAAPSATAPGTTPYCYTWYTVVSGDSCSDVAAAYGLTLAEFIALNTNVDTSCNGFWAGYSYCVSGVPVSSTTTSATPTTTTTSASSVATPTPTQTGMVSGCTVFYEAESGDGCYDIAAAYGITLDQFYAWNPAVGACANLWAGYYYCVGM